MLSMNALLISVLYMVELIASIFALKLALQKVFFKKYKRFELDPKIDKVGWWLPTKMHLILLVVGIAVFMLFLIIFFASAGISASSATDIMDQFMSVTSATDQQSRTAAIATLVKLCGEDVSIIKGFFACVLKVLLVVMLVDFLLVRHYVFKNATAKKYQNC
jgi:hypothetical protein